jgi:predicted metal-dependent HD superfamily phosphohydrolase
MDHDSAHFPRSHPLIAYALARLERELPSSLTYHTRYHTEDVLAEVTSFAECDRLSSQDIELLRVGAAFHDLGFVERISGNESIGARLASEEMQRSGVFSAAEVEAVETMIRDTEVKFLPTGPRQVPTTELSKYLCDADVSNLGRPDFLAKAELVRREINVPRDEVFFTNLRRFIGGHEWYTPAAQATRTQGKVDNLAALDRILRERLW